MLTVADYNEALAKFKDTYSKPLIGQDGLLGNRNYNFCSD